MEKSTQSVLIFNAFTFFHASLGIKSDVYLYPMYITSQLLKITVIDNNTLLSTSIIGETEVSISPITLDTNTNNGNNTNNNSPVQQPQPLRVTESLNE